MQFFSPPKLPASEPARHARLCGLQLLDTAPDPLLDAIVSEAADLYKAPIALISLLDSRRQWFKARHGLEVAETPRALSFCGHAILQPEPLIVLDARCDERFRGNPLVTAVPNVIFYAGVPLVMEDGHAVGTLCVIDHHPKTEVLEWQIARHQELARSCIDHLG